MEAKCNQKKRLHFGCKNATGTQIFIKIENL